MHSYIDNRLASEVAGALGEPPPEAVKVNPGNKSAFRSQLSPHNTFTASGRKIGIFVLDGLWLLSCRRKSLRSALSLRLLVHT
jgi:hypothetical protein